ncbi:MAG: hypothetical protein BRC30_02700 [Nanohaloarchaea archaeon SW_7_46_7]|nr:MAG: hypothetical protein BRC30_02700 [Nanohaloarchaea archaeon SW_7_46_7]
MNYIFDLDGTVFLNSDVALPAVKRMVKDAFDGKLLQTLKNPKNRYSEAHFQETKKRVDEGIICFADGAGKLVGSNYSAGLTNAPGESTDYKAEKFDLDDKMDLVLSTRDVERKPNPEGLEKIIENSGKDRDSFMFVGDSLRDLIAGKRAGIRTALITRRRWIQLLADEHYRTFEQFLEEHQDR